MTQETSDTIEQKETTIVTQPPATKTTRRSVKKKEESTANMGGDNIPTSKIPRPTELAKELISVQPMYGLDEVEQTKKVTNSKPITVEMFKIWLEGIEEMQEPNWHPSKIQWDRIRQKIDQLVESLPAPVHQQSIPQQPVIRGHFLDNSPQGDITEMYRNQFPTLDPTPPGNHNSVSATGQRGNFIFPEFSNSTQFSAEEGRPLQLDSPLGAPPLRLETEHTSQQDLQVQTGSRISRFA